MTDLEFFCNKITHLVKEEGLGESVYLDIRQDFDSSFCKTLIMDSEEVVQARVAYSQMD